MNTKPKLIVILGPTSSGKTGLSVELAKKFKAEIISADSRQVYRGLDLSSGKVTPEETEGIPHYLLDVASPKKVYTVAHFKKDADIALKKIYAKNKLPILIGGTGFYIDAVVQDAVLPKVKPDLALREKLEKKSAPRLFSLLEKQDPQRAATIDSHNKRRLVRALEIIRALGKVPKLQKKNLKFNVLYLGVSRSKEELKSRIHDRLLERISQGMIDEVAGLHRRGVSWQRLDDLGLECRYIARFLQNKITKEEMLDELERAIWRYAKRQDTWFKRNKKIHWVKNYKEAARLTEKFLASQKP